MKTAIILHGKPDKEEYFDLQNPAQSNRHWLPWLQRQLILKGVLAQTPEMPEPYEPDYKKWCSVFEQFTINKDTMLVGHSCGAGFLVRWLSENKVQVGKVALVAPWLDPAHELNSDFFSFEIDTDFPIRTDGVAVFVSSDDYKVILDSVEKIKNTSPLQIKEFDGRGHFTMGDMKTEQFPELRDFLIS